MSGDDRERGQCIVTTLHDHRGYCARVRIDRADPQVLITERLLEEWLACGDSPFVDFRPGPGASPLPGLHGFTGWLVTIRGENRTVIYRVGQKAPHAWAYEAEWPD